VKRKPKSEKIVGESKRTEFFKKYLELVVENHCLQAILDAHEAHNHPPREWREALVQLKQSPKCQAVYERCEQVLRQADEADFEKQVIQLAAEISKTKLPN